MSLHTVIYMCAHKYLEISQMFSFFSYCVIRFTQDTSEQNDRHTANRKPNSNCHYKCYTKLGNLYIFQERSIFGRNDTALSRDTVQRWEPEWTRVSSVIR